jgi:hypothetical protein
MGQDIVERSVLYSCYVNRQTRGLPETNMPKHEDYRATFIIRANQPSTRHRRWLW